MLAYYVEWHMREAWRNLMFADPDQQAKATHDRQCNTMAYHGRQFVGRIADAQVVAEGDAPVSSAVFKPLLVCPICRKEIAVPLNGEAAGREDIGKAFA